MMLPWRHQINISSWPWARCRCTRHMDRATSCISNGSRRGWSIREMMISCTTKAEAGGHTCEPRTRLGCCSHHHKATCSSTRSMACLPPMVLGVEGTRQSSSTPTPRRHATYRRRHVTWSPAGGRSSHSQCYTIRTLSAEGWDSASCDVSEAAFRLAGRACFLGFLECALDGFEQCRGLLGHRCRPRRNSCSELFLGTGRGAGMIDRHAMVGWGSVLDASVQTGREALEANYSGGSVVPHCKFGELAATSIPVLKLSEIL